MITTWFLAFDGNPWQCLHEIQFTQRALGVDHLLEKTRKLLIVIVMCIGSLAWLSPLRVSVFFCLTQFDECISLLVLRERTKDRLLRLL
jgi:hypothetical protein